MNTTNKGVINEIRVLKLALIVTIFASLLPPCAFTLSHFCLSIIVSIVHRFLSVKTRVGVCSQQIFKYCVPRYIGDSSIACRMLELERCVVTSAATTATSSTASDSGVGSEESGGLGYSGGKGDPGDTAGESIMSNKFPLFYA